MNSSFLQQTSLAFPDTVLCSAYLRKLFLSNYFKYNIIIKILMLRALFTNTYEYKN